MIALLLQYLRSQPKLSQLTETEYAVLNCFSIEEAYNTGVKEFGDRVESVSQSSAYGVTVYRVHVRKEDGK